MVLEWLPNIGAASLLAIVILLILSGRLIPRQLLLDMIAERDAWKNLALELLSQNKKMMVTSEVVADVVNAIPVQKSEEIL